MFMSVECYAQRLLNPFRGAMHTLRYDAAEAVTTDGVHWDIYVTNETLLDGLGNARSAQISEIRYGNWSQAKGLKRGPLYPSEDFLRMEEMGGMLYQHLTRVYDRVPFAFRDCYELWLLDEARQPLALLHSVIDETEIRVDLPIAWRAGYAARERFASGAMQRLGGNATNAGEYLDGYVNARAGKFPAAQWFRREADGAGAGLAGIGLPSSFESRSLPAYAFPPLFLAADGHDDIHRCLIADYHAWQAAWLLVLPLDARTRHALEPQAREQALLVESQYRLYPEIIDESLIKAALVEAILRRSQTTAEVRDNSLSTTYYFEFNPSLHE
jgi:hypothetical protein